MRRKAKTACPAACPAASTIVVGAATVEGDENEDEDDEDELGVAPPTGGWCPCPAPPRFPPLLAEPARPTVCTWLAGPPGPGPKGASSITSCPRALRMRMTRVAPRTMPSKRPTSSSGLERRRFAAAHPVRGGGGRVGVDDDDEHDAYTIFNDFTCILIFSPCTLSACYASVSLSLNVYVPVPAAAAKTRGSK